LPDTIYPSSEDIFNKSKKKSDINPEDVSEQNGQMRTPVRRTRMDFRKMYRGRLGVLFGIGYYQEKSEAKMRNKQYSLGGDATATMMHFPSRPEQSHACVVPELICPLDSDFRRIERMISKQTRSKHGSAAAAHNPHS